MLNKHISSCTNPHCSIPMCRSTRQQQHLYPTTATTYGSTAAQFQFVGNHSAPVVTVDSTRSGQAQLPPRSELLIVRQSSAFSATDIQSQGQDGKQYMSISAQALTRAKLRARAEEIVNRLDQEEPLTSNIPLSTYQQQPLSLMTQQTQQPSVAPSNTLPTHGSMCHDSSSNSSSYHSQMVGSGSSGEKLSSIIESLGNEDAFPSCNQTKSPVSYHGSELKCCVSKTGIAYPRQTLLYPLKPVSAQCHVCSYHK